MEPSCEAITPPADGEPLPLRPPTAGHTSACSCAYAHVEQLDGGGRGCAMMRDGRPSPSAAATRGWRTFGTRRARTGVAGERARASRSMHGLQERVAAWCFFSLRPLMVLLRCLLAHCLPARALIHPRIVLTAAHVRLERCIG